jgi:hypothetical protein
MVNTELLIGTLPVKTEAKQTKDDKTLAYARIKTVDVTEDGRIFASGYRCLLVTKALSVF